MFTKTLLSAAALEVSGNDVKHHAKFVSITIVLAIRHESGVSSCVVPTFYSNLEVLYHSCAVCFGFEGVT